MDGFNPELQLDSKQQADLVGCVSHPGFKVIQLIFKSSVDKFASALLNTDQKDRNDVLARHNALRVASQYYTAVVDDINHNVGMYKAMPRDGDKAADPTSNLDMGEAINFLYPEENDPEETEF